MAVRQLPTLTEYLTSVTTWVVCGGWQLARPLLPRRYCKLCRYHRGGAGSAINQEPLEDRPQALGRTCLDDKSMDARATDTRRFQNQREGVRSPSCIVSLPGGVAGTLGTCMVMLRPFMTLPTLVFPVTTLSWKLEKRDKLLCGETLSPGKR